MKLKLKLFVKNLKLIKSRKSLELRMDSSDPCLQEPIFFFLLF